MFSVAEHVCSVAASCFACTSNAGYGRCTGNGRICSTTRYGWNGDASHATLWDASNGEQLLICRQIVQAEVNDVSLEYRDEGNVSFMACLSFLFRGVLVPHFFPCSDGVKV